MYGVSVVICCHNSSQRLPQTVQHLLDQKVAEDINWEVIIVDNASTDDTSQVALSSWTADYPVPLRVVCEPRLGLTHARYRGLATANYEIISLVDDDNWLCPSWIETVSRVMGQQPEVALCGGASEPLYDEDPPEWFHRFVQYFAIGPQGDVAGNVTWTRGCLWGAGLNIRKSAWMGIVNDGFSPLLVDRQGGRLSTGGDTELCYALRLAGWQLWYEPSLVLKHVIPRSRLQWSHMRTLARSNGRASVWYDPYLFPIQGSPDRFKGRLGRIWAWRTRKVLRELQEFSRRRREAGLGCIPKLVGDLDVVEFEIRLGQLLELLSKRLEYDKSIENVWRAKWRRIP